MRNLSDATWFRLSAPGDVSGVSCYEGGVFVGHIPLLARVADERDREVWVSRPVADLNSALTASYGLPVDVSGKAGNLGTIARALNSHSLALAQIATLHLRMPDLPRLAKGRMSQEQMFALAAVLYQSGVLDIELASAHVTNEAAKRDVSSEPRIPRGQPGAGQWTTGGNTASSELPVVPTQAVPMPLPWGPLIRPGIRPLPPGVIRPMPPEIAPPLDIPGSVPREGIPQNPYPDRPECADEWDEAYRFCKRLKDQGLLGRGDYRGAGKNMWECMMGRVSENCGGNAIGA